MLTNISENGGVATATATLSEPSGRDVTVNLAAAGSATSTVDYTLSAIQIVIPAGAAKGSFTVTSVDDAIEEPDETVDLTITATNATVRVGTQSVMIIDDDIPPSFRFSSFSPTTGGFKVALSAAVDTSVLNLADTQTGGQGPPDATLVGATTGAITGSLVVSPDGREVEFLATGARLGVDTYTVALRSGDNGFKDTSGNLLDGNSDGSGGDDFSETFTVASNTTEIGVEDFIRGPGQDMNLPANSTDGLPITIDSDGAAIRNASFAIDYNPNLLSITGATPGAAMPAGSTASVDTSTSGRAVISFSSPIDLPAGPNTLVILQASVPTASAASIYGNQHVLDINSITLTNSAGAELLAIDNDGLHVVAFFGDVSGNGGINTSDASQVARVAASLDSGFAEFLMTDPMVVGDVSGNGVINATDASLVAQYAVELPVEEIPPIPRGVVVASSGRVSAKHALGTTPNTLVPSPATIHDRSKDPTALGFAVPVVVPHGAIDAMMARLENPEAADNDELLPALEDAVEQLLSASLAPATD